MMKLPNCISQNSVVKQSMTNAEQLVMICTNNICGKVGSYYLGTLHKVAAEWLF